MGLMFLFFENMCVYVRVCSRFFIKCVCVCFDFEIFFLLWVGFIEGFQFVKVNCVEIKVLCIFVKVMFISSFGKIVGQGCGEYFMIELWFWVLFF